MQSRHSTFSPCSSTSQTSDGAPLADALLMAAAVEMNSAWSAGSTPYTAAKPCPFEFGVTGRGGSLRASWAAKVAAMVARPPRASLSLSTYEVLMGISSSFASVRHNRVHRGGKRHEPGVLPRVVLTPQVHRVDGDGLALVVGERVGPALVFGVERIGAQRPRCAAVGAVQVELLRELRSSGAARNTPHGRHGSAYGNRAGAVIHLESGRVEDRHVRSRPGRDALVVVDRDRGRGQVERRNLVGRRDSRDRIHPGERVVRGRRAVVAHGALRCKNRLHLLIPGG